MPLLWRKAPRVLVTTSASSVVTLWLNPHQSPEQDILYVSPSIDKCKHEDCVVFTAVEQSPWREHHFPIAADALALELRHDASGSRML